MSDKDCAACGRSLDTLTFPGIFIDDRGGKHPHHLCSRCGQRAMTDNGSDVSNAVELRFLRSEGHA